MTTSPTPEKISELIQKLLNLSKSSNEHEASLALVKANELLLKYNLDMAQVRANVKQIEIGEMTNVGFPLREEWKRSLLSAIAKLCFCTTILSNGSEHVLGRTYNVLAAFEMFTWIAPQLEHIASVETVCYDGPGKLRFKNSFLWGATTRVIQRLRESRQSSLNSESTALITTISEETQNFLHTEYPSIHKRVVKTAYNPQAYTMGHSAGNSISISTTDRQIDTIPLLN